MNAPRRFDQRRALRNLEILALAEKMPPVQIAAQMGLSRGVVLGVCFRARQTRGPRARQPVADIAMWTNLVIGTPDRRALSLLSQGAIERRGGRWRFGTASVGDVVVERLVAGGRARIDGDRVFIVPSTHSSANCGGES